MQEVLQMKLMYATSENGYSLDELVCELDALMQEEGLPGILRLILQIQNDHLSIGLATGDASWSPEPCCEDPRYESVHKTKKSFRTSIGQTHVRWTRMRCRNCGKSFVPLREFLGLEPWQSKTGELERTVVETVADQSYRRGSRHLRTAGCIPVPRSTAHRWVAESDCDEMESGTGTMGLLLADGSGYKRRPSEEEGKNNRGEVRIAFGVETTGRIKPLGAWSRETWDEIASAIQGDREDEKPVAEMLVSDGEPGLGIALGRLCGSRQRCHWHGVRDLNYEMWRQKAPLEERREMQSELAGIIGVEIPADELDHIDEKDRQALIRDVEEAEKKVEVLQRKLGGKGYDEAAGYVARLKSQLFSYVRRWLETGLVSPRAASWIERTMREVARRLKRIAFGWSEEGAAKMTRIVIKRFLDKKGWDDYWKKKLRLDGNVRFFLRDLSLCSPTILGR